jgi:hypothetical protein
LRLANRPAFSDAPIPPVDVVMMGHILHDWDLNIKQEPALTPRASSI